MITINKRNLCKISELKLHDSEINQITCKYEEYEIIIPIVHYELKNTVILQFKNVLFSQISFYKLWGNGNYIFECMIDHDSESNILKELKELKERESNNNFETWSKLGEIENLNDFFTITLLLNSGDKIIIVANEFTFSE